MALDQPESNSGNQEETERHELEARSKSLKRIKADLLARIAALWANKDNEPVMRSDFKLIVKPGNKAVVTSFDIFPFSTVELFFEEEAEKMLQRVSRQYPGSNLIMEFLLFPYEHGGRRLRSDAVFNPVVSAPARKSIPVKKGNGKPEAKAEAEKVEQITVPAQEIEQERAEVKDQIIKTEIPVETESPTAVEAQPAVEVSPDVEVLTPQSEVALPSVEVPRTEEASPAILAPPAVEMPILPSKKERKSTLEELKKLIREAEAARSAGEGPDKDFSNSPIDYDFRKWNEYPKSQVLKRIRRAFEVNGINTPGEIVARLGTDNPTKKQWQDFIRSLNVAIGPNWLGESGSRDLIYWMRKNKLVKPDFRKE